MACLFLHKQWQRLPSQSVQLTCLARTNCATAVAGHRQQKHLNKRKFNNKCCLPAYHVVICIRFMHEHISRGVLFSISFAFDVIFNCNCIYNWILNDANNMIISLVQMKISLILLVYLLALCVCVFGTKSGLIQIFLDCLTW